MIGWWRKYCKLKLMFCLHFFLVSARFFASWSPPGTVIVILVVVIQGKNVVGVTFLEEQHYKSVWHDSKNLSCADSTWKRPLMGPTMHDKHDRRNYLACCASQIYTNRFFFLDSRPLPRNKHCTHPALIHCKCLWVWKHVACHARSRTQRNLCCMKTKGLHLFLGKSRASYAGEPSTRSRKHCDACAHSKPCGSSARCMTNLAVPRIRHICDG